MYFWRNAVDDLADNVVDDLVAYFANELAEVTETEIAAVPFFELLLKCCHGDRRLLGKLVTN